MSKKVKIEKEPEPVNEAPTPQDIEVATMIGDVRDKVLAEFKTMPKPWQKMSEQEQERVIHRSWDIAEYLVKRTVDLVASEGVKSLPITVGKLSVEGSGIKGVFETRADDESLITIRHLQGKRAMFVLADVDAYKGEREKPRPDNVGDLAIPPGISGDDLDEVFTAADVERQMQAEADYDPEAPRAGKAFAPPLV